MRQIGNLLETGYMNAGELMSLDDEQTSRSLLGELKEMDPVDRHITMKKLFKTKTPSQGSRLEFEKHFIELPPHISTLLLEEKLRLSDVLVYAVKPVISTTTRMFREQDVIQVSISSISNSRLPRNMALLVSGIYLLQGQSVSSSIDDIKNVKFDTISPLGALANGEFTLKSNKKHLIAGHAMSGFAYGSHALPKGYIKLDNPRLIPDDTEIELEIEIGTTTGIPANTFLFAGLHGTATIP